jgi:hypothetical protein
VWFPEGGEEMLVYAFIFKFKIVLFICKASLNLGFVLAKKVK